jgi:hypothetical protein
VAIAALVLGRTKSQCSGRWHHCLDPSIDWVSGRAFDDSKLKDAVQTHGDKGWDTIALLVPGRTKNQCYGRWRDVLGPFCDQTTGRKGHWTLYEDDKLKVSVQTHGGKNWVAISALIPGRSRKQCRQRWKLSLEGFGTHSRWQELE